MKKMLSLIVLSVLLVIAIIIIIRSCNSTVPPNNEQSTETSSTLDFTPFSEYKDKSISIPGVTGLNFKSGQLQQTVDLYNPKENNCYFVISLYLSDDTLIYKSDFLAPSETLTEITLLQALQKGTYKNCRLVYNCYALDNRAVLNSGTVICEINSY
ncbi:MAG: hypothetical protein ACI4I6_07150 [Hominimerdicola sp.]